MSRDRVFPQYEFVQKGVVSVLEDWDIMLSNVLVSGFQWSASSRGSFPRLQLTQRGAGLHLAGSDESGTRGQYSVCMHMSQKHWNLSILIYFDMLGTIHSKYLTRLNCRGQHCTNVDTAQPRVIKFQCRSTDKHQPLKHTCIKWNAKNDRYLCLLFRIKSLQWAHHRLHRNSQKGKQKVGSRRTRRAAAA